MTRILVGALLWFATLVPAQAAVTITFWSHELGASFPHAFVSLRGTPDAGGPAVDGNYGFTATAVSPAILLKAVKSEIYTAKPGYVASSQAQFSLVLNDAQYAQVLALIRDWGRPEVRYSLSKRNCIHFVQEAARLLGLDGLDQPKLMRRPRSYLLAVAESNHSRVTIIGLSGRDYLAGLEPLTGEVVKPVPAATLERDP